MSNLHSVRVPAALIVTALLVIILMSSSHTTYTFAPTPSGYVLAARESRKVVLAPMPEMSRSCPASRLGHANATLPDWLQDSAAADVE